MKRRLLTYRALCWIAWLLSISPAVLQAADVPQPVLAAEQQRIEAIQRATQSAVCVFSLDGKGGGSGVVVTADGYALTNFHVVQPCGDYMKCGMADGRVYDAVIVGVDPTGDVALIKLLGREDFPAAQMGNSDSVRVGDWCFAVGNPFLLATDLQPSVSYGIVSGVHRYQYPAGTLLEYADCIQTDAAINPGNSGGPLFNAAGELIGINGRGSFEKRGRVNVGVGYAISINQIKNFLGYLRSGRIVDHATLGATVVTNDDDKVIVSNILESSDAHRRGLRYGDEIVAFGGRKITTVNGFKNVLGIFPRDWRVPLSYRRNGRTYDVLVRLDGVHTREQLVQAVQRAPAMPDPGPGPEKKPDRKAPENPDGAPPDDHGPDPHDNSASPHGAPPAMPDHIKALFQARLGYANYHFNRQERDRVWNSFIAHGDLRGALGGWKIVGESADSAVEVALDEDVVFARLPDGPARIDPKADLGSQLAPAGSGGLLVALHLWKRLLTLGPDKFGEVYYLGQAPLPSREGLFDVLIATHDVVECRFYFEPAGGRLVAMEMFPEIDVDPCELYFDDYRVMDGKLLPHRIEVIFGNDRVADIRLSTWTLPNASATSSPPAQQEIPRAP